MVDYPSNSGISTHSANMLSKRSIKSMTSMNKTQNVINFCQVFLETLVAIILLNVHKLQVGKEFSDA